MIRKSKATYEQGALRLAEPLPLADGTPVEVTVIASETDRGRLQETDESSWDALTELLAECATDTGIADLASQHDYYLYGIPKTIRDADRTSRNHPENIVHSSPKGL
jgi:predicted DNA-binding antitoxin AbrB/MazE fold protein